MSASVRLTRHNHRGPSLLKQIAGRRTDSPDIALQEAAVVKEKAVIDLERPMDRDIMGLPVDSGEDSPPVRKRADIKHTSWKPSGPGKPMIAPRASRKPGKRQYDSESSRSTTSRTSSAGKRSYEEDTEETPSTQSSLQSQAPPLHGSQHSLFQSSQTGGKRAKNKKYGKKTYGSSQNKPPSSPEKKEPKKEFQVCPALSSPEPSPKKQFNMPFSSPKSEKKKTAVFQKHEALSPPPIKQGFKVPSMAFSDDDDDEDDSVFGPLDFKPKDTKKKKGVLKEEEEKDTKPPKLEFMTHDILDLEEPDTKTSNAEFNPQNMLDSEEKTMLKKLGFSQVDLEMADQESEPLAAHLTECPMCKAPVEKKHLESFSKGQRMTVSSQTKFCHSHQKRSAKVDWKTKGYPTINWDTLNTRINRHHSFLSTLLLPSTNSFYHEKMTKALRSSSRNALTIKSIISNGGTLTPGYYGTRGLRIMSENIMEKFTPQLRKLAKSDDLMFAQGVSPYVQTVLVPELACRLIGEDMGVEIGEAREILSDSAGVGDLLQEELDDVVV